MEKLRAQHRKFMAGKAGFSLVELIIVIAIMAALIAVLAPQYIKYVEKSRVTADEDQIEQVMESVKIALADPDNTPVACTFVITDGASLTVTGAASADTTAANKLLTTVKDSLGMNASTTFAFKSTTYKGKTVKVTVAVTAGNFTVTKALSA